MNLKQWWRDLAERERQMVSIGGAVVAILFVYAAIWSPLSDTVSSRKADVAAQQKLLRYLQHANQMITQLKAEGIAVADNQVELLSLTEQTLSQQNLSGYLKQVAQPKQNEVSLQFESVPFDRLMQWMETLATRHAVRIEQFNATRLPDVGTANVTMVLGMG